MGDESLGAGAEDPKYVPDVSCPSCGQDKHLDAATYALYWGEVRCSHCLALFVVEIGDVQTFGSHLHWPERGARGGKLLGAPELREPSESFPQALLTGIRSEAVAAGSRRHIETAVRHYEDREYASVAVPCRAAIQIAFQDYKIQDGPISRMIDEARELGLIKGFVARCCEAVASAAGESAHSAEPSKNQTEALAVIRMTAAVLARLYALS